MELYPVQAGGLDLLHGLQGVFRVGVHAAEAVQAVPLALHGEAVDGGLLVGVGGDVQHHASAAAPLGEFFQGVPPGAVGVGGAAADLPQPGQGLPRQLIWEEVDVGVEIFHRGSFLRGGFLGKSPGGFPLQPPTKKEALPQGESLLA